MKNVLSWGALFLPAGAYWSTVAWLCEGDYAGYAVNHSGTYVNVQVYRFASDRYPICLASREDCLLCCCMVFCSCPLRGLFIGQVHLLPIVGNGLPLVVK